MKTVQTIDFLAPLPNPNLTLVPLFLPSQPAIDTKVFQVDPADRFTYIIMGLAVLIAILIPLLNWN